MNKQKLLLVDDDPSLLRVLEYQLQQAGFDVIPAKTLAQGQKAFDEHLPDIILTDLSLPDGTGLDLLRFVRQNNTETIVIVITAFGTVDNALEACKQGANDYLTKPFSREQLRFAIEKAVRLRKLEAENSRLHSELGAKFDFSEIIGHALSIQKTLELVARVAPTETSVLILGESGTGKELAARSIHFNSPRKNAPFITVNCPSIPDHLLESELFGHKKGAFTGAIRDRKGKFEMAAGGTIFLDEIGDLKPDMQARILRVLQNREYEPVGGEKILTADVRIIAATHRNLQQHVQDKHFREDLYYRLSVFPIEMPPLRNRISDIPALVDHFVKKSRKDRPSHISSSFIDVLTKYDWPGNVRELENIIERALILSDDGKLTPGLLPENLRSPSATTSASQSEEPISEQNLSLNEIEKRAVIDALRASGGNQSAAAKRLGVPRHILLYRLKKYKIELKRKNEWIF